MTIQQRDSRLDKELRNAVNNWLCQCPHLEPRHDLDVGHHLGVCRDCVINLIDNASLLCGHRQVRTYCVACQKGDPN